MLFNTKINEFEPEAIDLLIGVVQEKIDDLNHKYQRLTMMDPGELRADLMVLCDKNLDTFILWKVQLENAKSDIEEMLKPITN